MALRIICPGCKTALTLDDATRGRKIRCSECEKALSIPAAGGTRPNREKQEAIQEGRNRTAQAPLDDDEERDEEEPRPTKKKKKKKAKGGGIAVNFGVNSLYILVGVVVLVLFGAAAVPVYFLLREKPEAPPAKVAQAAKVEEKPAVKIIPGIKEGNPDKKGGTYVISSVRGAGYRAERRNELRNIGQSYIQFFDEYKGAARTEENFLQYINTFGPIRDAIKDGYYKMNMKAGLDSNSIICYERDIDTGNRYLCVRGDGSVDYVPLEQWKKILGIP